MSMTARQALEVLARHREGKLVVTTMTAVGVFFLLISVPSMALTRYLERRFGRKAT